MSKESPQASKQLVSQSELGKHSEYDERYNPQRLLAIGRAEKRQEIGIDPELLPFSGFDCWNHYEVSWLNEKGKPVVAIAAIRYDCHSPYLVESKSLKLYFNSLNNSSFNSADEVASIVTRDLEAVIGCQVVVTLTPMSHCKAIELAPGFAGRCLDEQDVECTEYLVTPDFLQTSNEFVNRTCHSNLLKSNCLVTNQPDWGSVQISYVGLKIDEEGLLKYIVSFRHHNEFHEQCIERIFIDIMRRCKPKELTVYGRYTRRGGIDINPFRSTQEPPIKTDNARLIRQ